MDIRLQFRCHIPNPRLGFFQQPEEPFISDIIRSGMESNLDEPLKEPGQSVNQQDGTHVRLRKGDPKVYPLGATQRLTPVVLV